MKTVLNHGVKILKGSKAYYGEAPDSILTPELKEGITKLEEKTKKGKDAEAKFFKSRESKKPVEKPKAESVQAKPKLEEAKNK
jgi:hypothetical protein